MKNSYRFYYNNSCEYFPCHKNFKEENFNCLFCYNPLYMMGDCGGNYTIHSGIKDCSCCFIPHKPEGYDYINMKTMEYNRENIKE